MDLNAAIAWARRRFFELLTLLMAIVAIIFAFIQYGDSRTELAQSQAQIEQARAQLARLEQITSSIQTQYAGEFPVNLNKITYVINQAADRGELDIMTDFAGYAIYSRNDKFREYFDALIKAHHERLVQVKMMVYDKDLVEKAFRIQIKVPDFEEERQNGFRGFFKTHPPTPQDYNGFIHRIIELQDDVANDLCRNGIEVRRVPASQKYLFFLWQTNIPEAVFAFRNEAARNREISFHTLDPKLTEIFKTIFDQTWASVDPRIHPELAATEDPACQYLTQAKTPQ